MTTRSPRSDEHITRGSLPLRWPVPDLGQVAITAQPFRYATVRDSLPTRVGEAILEWFENGAPWQLVTTDFYEQFEFNCWDATSPAATYLTSSQVLARVRSTMSYAFGLQFEDRVDVVSHMLLLGQRIGIHNDYLMGEETHRLVIQLNRGGGEVDGGVLMLFNSDDAADIHALLRPVNLTGLAFEISPESYHAVSQVYAGARYTIIFSLRAADAPRSRR